MRCALPLLLFAAVSSASAQSPGACPWFTAGSAARLLGGEVAASIDAASPKEGSCRFALKSTPETVLEIHIGPADTHACPAGSAPVKALGNTAVACHRESSGSSPVDVITGRIRDLYFVLSIAGKLPAPDANSQWGDKSPDSFLERAAEQVVGNLY
jgi:hypothetical protein